jgi:methionine-rich copper-binding protein CopC
MKAIHLVIRIVVILFGVVVLLFGVMDLVVPRATFVSSNPPAGAVINEPPSIVTVNFSDRLAPESSIDVTSTIKLLPSGETDYLDGSSIMTEAGIDSNDPSGKSMRANLRPDLHKGLYFVNWRTTTKGWRTVTYGKTAFGVGMPIPEHITRDMNGKIWERNYDWRNRRAALVGGVIMIALGIFLPMPSQNWGR